MLLTNSRLARPQAPSVAFPVRVLWKCKYFCPGKVAVACLLRNKKKKCLVLQSRLLLNDKNMTLYQCLPVVTWYVLCALPCSLLPFLISLNLFRRISHHSVQETTWRRILICKANNQSPSVLTDLLSGWSIFNWLSCLWWHTNKRKAGFLRDKGNKPSRKGEVTSSVLSEVVK